MGAYGDLKIERFFLNNKLIILSLSTLSLAIITIVLHLIENGGIGFADHQWLWAECVCTLRGIDSAEAIKNGVFVQDVTLPASTSTLPWTKILGIVLHGSFLNFKYSKIYYALLNTIVLSGMFAMVYHYMHNYTKSKKNAIACVLLMLSSWYHTDFLINNNNATMVCAFIIMAILLQDNHEYLSGVLVACAMVKPQIVLPFCIVWVLKKKWKLLATASTIDAVCWGASGIITGVSPLRQISNILNMRVDMSEEYLVYGIFDALRFAGVSSITILVMSMVLGCLVTIVGYHVCEKLLPNRYLWIHWSLPAVVSVFWCYKSQCDYNILMIVALAVAELVLAKESRQTMGVAIATMISLLMKPVAFVFALSSYLGICSRTDGYYISNRLDLYLKCFAYAIFIFYAITVLKHQRGNADVD